MTLELAKMSKRDTTINTFLDKLIFPILVALFTPVIATISSKINSGKWLSWVTNLPKSVIIVFIVIVTFWFVAVVIRKRLKKIRDQNSGPGIQIVDYPVFGWITFGEMGYAEVIWRMRSYAPSPGEIFDPNKINTNAIKVETPPRCPKCKTEIEENSSFWGGYVWKCVGCGYTKRNKASFYDEADRAERVARRQMERQSNLD
jgi:ribosomal protein L37AE/L43A